MLNHSALATIGLAAVDVTQVIITCALLIGLVLVLFLGVWYYRRRFLAADEGEQAIWTFDDLRRMRDKGELTEEEYQALRSSMIGSYRERIEPPKPDKLQRPDLDDQTPIIMP